MRLKLDLSLTTLTDLFQPGDGGGYFPGPVISVSSLNGREIPGLVTGFNWRRNAKDGSVVFDFSEPILYFGAGRSNEPRKCFLDLSIPWVHERVAATCLCLLGVPDVRAACMTCPPASAPWPPTTGLWTLRWVDGEDGLPRTASWRADAQAGTTAPTTARPCTVRQNDVERARVFSRSSVKAGAIPSLTLNADASHHAALIALVQALDVSVSGRT